MVHLQNTLGNRDSLKGVNSSPVGFVPDVLVLAVEFQAFGMIEKEGGWLIFGKSRFIILQLLPERDS